MRNRSTGDDVYMYAGDSELRVGSEDGGIMWFWQDSVSLKDERLG